MGDRGAARAEAPIFANFKKHADERVRPSGREVDGREGGRLISLDLPRQQEETGQRQEHWEEVELVLEMWESVARSWKNETLMRLARYAKLEAETERDLERKTR